MSRCQYDGNHWCPNMAIFTTVNQLHGALQQRHGVNMGGTWAYALLGPDLRMPGGGGINPPMAQTMGFNLPWMGANRPGHTFSEDVKNWIIGHMINGEWHGSGANWNNLTPLTQVANTNHSTIENSVIKKYLNASLAYEDAAHRPSWFGIEYLVQCAIAPWGTPDVSTNLYAYAPEFMRISWRAVEIQKSTHTPVVNVPAAIGALVRNPVAVLPFNPHINNAYIGNTCLPAPGNVPGGAVHTAGAPVLGPAQANGFDGGMEIHQQ